MPHYVGLDVSQKTTSICVVDEQGRRLWRGVCTTHPDPIATRVLRHAGGDAKIGIETGSMTPWLIHGLRAAGLDVACLDARRVKAALQMRQAAKSHPARKPSGAGTRAVIAVAAIGPMPGIVMSRRATGSA